MYDEKHKMEKNLENIRLFLIFFENYDLNEILFIKEKYFNELFSSFDEETFVRQLAKHLQAIPLHEAERFYLCCRQVTCE